MRSSIGLLLAISLPFSVIATGEAPKQEKPAKDEKVYIPKDLDDAVRELNRLIRPEDKELIKKGEVDSVDMHFGLGMGLRNSWGLWGGSRLAVYFKEQGINHPDSMSSYVLDAFCRNLRGQKFDLLSIMRDNMKDWPIVEEGAYEGKVQAVLFRSLDYDSKFRVVSTSLLWNPDDGRTYLEVGLDKRLATEREIKQFRESKAGWNFTTEEEKVLAVLRSATPDERLQLIKKMTEEQRRKFDGLLLRAKDPEGLDKRPPDPFDVPSSTTEHDGHGQPVTRPESK